MPASARSQSVDLGPAGLPAGWELCLLQAVGAPVTSANVADLDGWQAAEGGSTANDIAYNPFNTRRSTDRNQATLPTTLVVSGFPAFATWPAGCAATAATILQPDMAPIAAALVAGDVSPPAAFLAVVDETPWCAPSGGVPCYMGLISGSASAPAPQTASVAMGLYRSTATDLDGYDADVRAATAVESALAGDRQQLAGADVAVSFARFSQQQAIGALRRAAVYEYTSNPALDRTANLLYFQVPTERDLLTQVYDGADMADLVAADQRAGELLAKAQAARRAAADEVTRTTAQLATAQEAVGQALARAAIQLVVLQAAGACAAGAGPPPAAPGDGAPVAELRACVRSLGA